MDKKATSVLQGQPPKVWVKLALLLVIIVSTAALLITYVYIAHLRETIDDQEQQILEQQETIEYLQNCIDHKDTDEGIKDVASGELGMIDPDTEIHEFN